MNLLISRKDAGIVWTFAKLLLPSAHFLAPPLPILFYLIIFHCLVTEASTRKFDKTFNSYFFLLSLICKRHSKISSMFYNNNETFCFIHYNRMPHRFDSIQSNAHWLIHRQWLVLVQCTNNNITYSCMYGSNAAEWYNYWAYSIAVHDNCWIYNNNQLETQLVSKLMGVFTATFVEITHTHDKIELTPIIISFSLSEYRAYSSNEMRICLWVFLYACKWIL